MKKEKDIRHLSVFLADDDEDDVYFITKAFSEAVPNAKLTRFANGQLLLSALDISPTPDAILLDLNMPLLDGRETLRQVKRKFGSTVPVIILSTSNHTHEKELCIEYGADTYFVKPYSFEGYLNIFRSLRSQWLEKEYV